MKRVQTMGLPRKHPGSLTRTRTLVPRLHNAIRKAKAVENALQETETPIAVSPVARCIDIPEQLRCVQVALFTDDEFPVPTKLLLSNDLAENRKDLLVTAMNLLDKGVSVAYYADPWTHHKYPLMSQLQYCNILNRLFQSILRTEVPWHRMVDLLSSKKPVEQQLALSRLSVVQQWTSVPPVWSTRLLEGLFSMMDEHGSGDMRPMILYCAMRLLRHTAAQQHIPGFIRVSIQYWLPELDPTLPQNRKVVALSALYSYMKSAGTADVCFQHCFNPLSTYVWSEHDKELNRIAVSLQTLLLGSVSTSVFHSNATEKSLERLLSKKALAVCSVEELPFRAAGIQCACTHLLHVQEQSKSSSQSPLVHLLEQFLDYNLLFFTQCGLTRSEDGVAGSARAPRMRLTKPVLATLLSSMRCLQGFFESPNQAIQKVVLRRMKTFQPLLAKLSSMGVPTLTMLCSQATAALYTMIEGNSGETPSFFSLLGEPLLGCIDDLLILLERSPRIASIADKHLCLATLRLLLKVLEGLDAETRAAVVDAKGMMLLKRLSAAIASNPSDGEVVRLSGVALLLTLTHSSNVDEAIYLLILPALSSLVSKGMNIHCANFSLRLLAVMMNHIDTNRSLISISPTVCQTLNQILVQLLQFIEPNLDMADELRRVTNEFEPMEGEDDSAKLIRLAELGVLVLNNLFRNLLRQNITSCGMDVESSEELRLSLRALTVIIVKLKHLTPLAPWTLKTMGLGCFLIPDTARRLKLASILFLIIDSSDSLLEVQTEAIYTLEVLLFQDIRGVIEEVETEIGSRVVEGVFCRLLMSTDRHIAVASSQFIARIVRRRQRQLIEHGAPEHFCKVLKNTRLPEVALNLLIALEVLTRNVGVQERIGAILIPMLLFFVQDEPSVETAATAVKVLKNLLTHQKNRVVYHKAELQFNALKRRQAQKQWQPPTVPLPHSDDTQASAGTSAFPAPSPDIPLTAPHGHKFLFPPVATKSLHRKSLSLPTHAFHAATCTSSARSSPAKAAESIQVTTHDRPAELPPVTSLQSLICRPLLHKAKVPRAELTRKALMDDRGVWLTETSMTKPLELHSSNSSHMSMEQLREDISNSKKKHWDVSLLETKMRLISSSSVSLSNQDNSTEECGVDFPSLLQTDRINSGSSIPSTKKGGTPYMVQYRLCEHQDGAKYCLSLYPHVRTADGRLMHVHLRCIDHTAHKLDPDGGDSSKSAAPPDMQRFILVFNSWKDDGLSVDCLLRAVKACDSHENARLALLTATNISLSSLAKTLPNMLSKRDYFSKEQSCFIVTFGFGFSEAEVDLTVNQYSGWVEDAQEILDDAKVFAPRVRFFDTGLVTPKEMWDAHFEREWKFTLDHRATGILPVLQRLGYTGAQAEAELEECAPLLRENFEFIHDIFYHFNAVSNPADPFRLKWLGFTKFVTTFGIADGATCTYSDIDIVFRDVNVEGIGVDDEENPDNMLIMNEFLESFVHLAAESSLKRKLVPDLPSSLKRLLALCKENAVKNKECIPGSVEAFRRTLYPAQVSNAIMPHVSLLRKIHRTLAAPYHRKSGLKKISPPFGPKSVVYMSYDGFKQFLDEVGYSRNKKISKRDIACSFVNSMMISPIPKQRFFFPEHLNFTDFLEAICRLAAIEHPDVAMDEAVSNTLGSMIANLDRKYGDGDGKLSASEFRSFRINR